MKTLILLSFIILSTTFCGAKEKNRDKSSREMAELITKELLKDQEPAQIGLLKMVTGNIKIEGIEYSLTWSQFWDEKPKLTISGEEILFEDYDIDGQLKDSSSNEKYKKVLEKIVSHLTRSSGQHWVKNP